MASIRKRQWTSRDKEGREKEGEAWVVRYADQQGKWRLKTFAAKKEAEAWRDNAVHEVRQGTHTPASASKTIEQAWELWIEDCEANKLEFGTIQQRRQHLKHHVKDFIGRIKLAELSTPRVYQFDSQLREAGRSLSIRRKVLTTLKTMLAFALKRGLVAQNVASTVRIQNNDREAARGPLRAGTDFPSMAELKLIIENSTGRWRPLLVTAIFTGMRASELRGLRWADVDLFAGVIHVRQRADTWANIGATKSKAGKRDIPLAPIVVNALKQWQADCPKGELDLVFPNGRGNVESLTNIYKRCWQPLQIKSGITVPSEKTATGEPIMEPRYGFHMLRHAAASLFIQYLGWTPKRLQTVMGHSSINMTFDLYGHLFENIEADRADMAKIEAAVRAA
jgi:integrase